MSQFDGMMNRFDGVLTRLTHHLENIDQIMENSGTEEGRKELLNNQLVLVVDFVYQLKQMLGKEDTSRVIPQWLRIENRLRRLRRLVELQSPTVIIQNENQWLKKMVREMEQLGNGFEPDLYTEEEQEELAMERDFFDEEEFALDRIKGAILGHAIGDAMGATTEFMEPNEICRKYGTVTDILGGGWLHLKPGETTDDTAMSLCVAEGILESPDNPIDAIGQAFLRWEATDPEDIGNTIRSSLDHFNGDWLEAAYQTHLEFDGYTGGNGSLMRCLPVALAYTDSDKMEDITERQSKMTHYDDIASEACLIYNRIAARVLNGDNLLLALVAETDGTRYHNVFLDRPSCSPDGFVVNTFTWVLYLLWTYDSFAEVVQQATNEGYDSDTVAAIAGGLKGLSTQSFGLPQEWVNKLRNRKQLEKAAEDLYQLRQSMLGMTSQPAGTND